VGEELCEAVSHDHHYDDHYHHDYDYHYDNHHYDDHYHHHYDDHNHKVVCDRADDHDKEGAPGSPDHVQW